ncbi:MAG: translation initiation factor [Planctomycetota bacterium]|nr:MAG: translation initiation factor [Planctomycetota bacterium]REJ86762.1 MAG: translation initiation factor [Planctomycetota bacterium]REK23658.1 MAG: translation initiation factor [Planctomycetota bacterium]REK31115.1 MAG: translation initiation factor [Planctomycetota bacterium]
MRLFAGTEFDRPPRCKRCGEPEEECACPPDEPTFLPPEKQTAKLTIEKRKKGKQVTVVRGLSATESDFPALLRRLQAACGAGGSIAENVIEIQGRQVDRVRAILEQIGYRVRTE